MAAARLDVENRRIDEHARTLARWLIWAPYGLSPLRRVVKPLSPEGQEEHAVFPFAQDPFCAAIAEEETTL
jgi:hypothetical protein